MDHRPIRKILIANRAEIACRITRTAREMGIATVAVFSDADDGMPHIREADEAVRLPGLAPADTYLRGDLMINAAKATGADAIHPGYGFLAENAAFAAACATAGLTFIGPSARTIELMGSKIVARELMAAAGVPVLAGSSVEPTTTESDLRTMATEIGLPVIVKASAGGGGRGMRVVRSCDELAEAVASAQREAESAFGDGTVFVERYVEGPRHIEVQIFGDHTGRVISLFERECSIQRRHQKIIEEAPSAAVTPQQREQLCAAACMAGSAIGYVGAGTVEFVTDGAGDFYFLEVNTRLQVEHPVTELVTGLDLVRLQIEIASGLPLPDAAVDARVHGHAIEARLYAEDVVAGFIPASGPVHRLRVPAPLGVRADSGYEDGSHVSTFYDAMLSKVIAWAPTRAEAAAILASALSNTEIHGVITNRDLLVNTLVHPEFIAGRTDTAFYERNDPRILGQPRGGTAVQHVHALAAALAPHDGTPSPHPIGIPRGWRNVGPRVATTELRLGDQPIIVVVQHSPDLSTASINGEPLMTVSVASATRDLVEFEVGGVRHRVRLHHVGAAIYADSALGSSSLQLVERFAPPETKVAEGSLTGPMPGTVVGVHAAVGDAVAAGQILVTLEAMKMEHSMRAPLAGTVTELRVNVGDQVDRGAVLAVVVAAGQE